MTDPQQAATGTIDLHHLADIAARIAEEGATVAPREVTFSPWPHSSYELWGLCLGPTSLLRSPLVSQHSC